MPAVQEQRQVPEVAAPQHYAPATARELRAQAIHRLQLGLFGLAAMLLIVGLSNIIMDRARLGDAEADPQQVTSAPTTASDPLADIGVVPAPVATSTSKSARPKVSEPLPAAEAVPLEAAQ
jgi:hypothetical protein